MHKRMEHKTLETDDHSLPIGPDSLVRSEMSITGKKLVNFPTDKSDT